MRSRLLGVCMIAATSAPLAAQTSPSLERLAFMSGCWVGPYTSQRGTGTIEERYTLPSANVILGTTRYDVGGRTTDYEFNLIQRDSAGIALIPFPNGERSPHAFRLRLAGDTAYFEAPEHDYPKRVSYRRMADGSLLARIDSGAADPGAREWRMSPVACNPPLTVAGVPGGAVPAGTAGTAGPAAPDRSGRVMLYFTQTLNGLYLGLAVPSMFGTESEGAYGLGLLLGPATGILFAKAVNDARPVSTGQATAITWGGWWGAWTAASVTALNSGADDKTYWRNTTIGLIGGTAVGLVFAGRPISAGDASLVAHSSVWGTWYGLVAATIANADDAWPYVLVGGNAALLAAGFATKHVEVSSGRVWVTTASGIAGLVAGFGIDLIASADGNTAILIPAATSFVGLAVGLAATRNMDRTRVGLGPQPAPALLGMRNGSLHLGLPSPTPALVPRNSGGRYRMVPGMRLTLFELRH